MNVFISYSSKDKTFVEKLYDRLTKDNVTCFMDKEKIKDGDNWVTELEKAIKKSSAILYVISTDFIESKWVEKERTSAIALNKKQFAVEFKKVNDEDLPAFLAPIQKTDLSSESKFEQNYPHLCKILKKEQTQKKLQSKSTKEIDKDTYKKPDKDSVKSNKIDAEYRIDEKTKQQKKQSDEKKIIIASLMCNRGEQEEEFIEFFKENIKKYPKEPQFYFVHGCSNDAHYDLIERFRMTVKNIMKKELNKDIIPGSIKAQWPVKGKLKNQKKQLARNIIRKFDSKFGGFECTINDMCDLNCMADSEIFFIRHEITTSNWIKKKKLISWYMKNFFSDIDWKSEQKPLFLIFFKIRYNEKNLLSRILFLNSFKKIISSWKINKLIKKYKKTGNKKNKSEKIISFPCRFISPLHPISREEFEGWIDNYINMDWAQRDNLIDSIYKRKNKMLMGEIRPMLIEIEKKHLRLTPN